MIRLAIVEQESNMGGVEYSTLYLASTLERQHYTPIVIAPEEGPLTKRCQAANIPVLLSPRPQFRSASFRLAGHTLADPLAMLLNMQRLWQASRPLIKQLRACRADLVLTKGLLVHFYGGWAARQLAIPCIWHVQDEVPTRRAAGLYLRFLQAAAQQLAKAVIGDADSIAAQYPTHPHVYTVYNGIDVTEYSPTSSQGILRTELGIPSDSFLIGNMARLTDWKGQHILIEAFNHLANEFPALHLVLIGSALFDNDNYEQRLHRLAAASPASQRIHFAGYRTDTANSLAALDIYVHPSLRKDTAPLALLSALATGLPTIISAIPGMLEVVQPGISAQIFQPGDHIALAEQIRHFLMDPHMRGRFSAAARASAIQRFSIQAHTTAMSEILTAVLGEEHKIER